MYASIIAVKLCRRNVNLYNQFVKVHMFLNASNYDGIDKVLKRLYNPLVESYKKSDDAILSYSVISIADIIEGFRMYLHRLIFCFLKL